MALQLWCGGPVLESISKMDETKFKEVNLLGQSQLDHVVDTRSFSVAARQLGIARSAISRHVSLLEKSIGIRLLNRTTSRLSLTEAGETYFQSCARIVAEADMATQRVSQCRMSQSVP